MDISDTINLLTSFELPRCLSETLQILRYARIHAIPIPWASIREVLASDPQMDTAEPRSIEVIDSTMRISKRRRLMTIRSFILGASGPHRLVCLLLLLFLTDHLEHGSRHRSQSPRATPSGT